LTLEKLTLTINCKRKYMSNQSDKQQSVRDLTGTAYSYNGDWHALFDLNGIPVGTYDERLLSWINNTLSSSYANLPSAMQAFAEDQGFDNWESMGSFSSLTITSFDFSSALPAGFTLTRSGGTATYRDSDGNLQQAAANFARFHHDVSGNPLGLLVENTAVNKCLGANANPIDTTGVSITNGTVELVDDSVALAASGLGDICSSGIVFKLTNTSGTSVVTLSDVTGNVNPHSYIVYARGEGGTSTIEVPATASSSNTVTVASIYSEYSFKNLIPSATTRTLRAVITSGRVLYVILQHLEENKDIQTVIVNEASGSTSTRNRDLVFYTGLNTAPWWSQDAGAMFVEHKPLALGVEMGIISASQDVASNDYHISQRMLATSGLIDADYKSGSDVMTNTVGTALYDDFMISGVTWEDGGTGEVISSRGMRFEPANIGTMAVTLDALYIGRSVKFFGYYTGLIKNVYVFKGKPTFDQATTAFLGVNDVGVAFGGQSNSEGFDKKTTTGSNAGQVAIIAELDNYYTTGRNFTSNMAIGGAGLYQRNNTFDYYLENDGVTAGNALINLIRTNQAVKDNLKFFYWAQGSTDVNAETTASLKAGWLEVFNQWRAGVAEIPVLIGRPFRRNDSDSSDAGYVKWNDAISELVAEYDWIHEAPNTKIYQGSWQDTDPAADDVHMSSAGYAEAGAIVIRKGLSIIDTPPTITGAVDGAIISSVTGVGTSTIDINLTLPSGITDTSIATGTEADGFIFEDDGTPIAWTTAPEKISATVWRGTLASTPAGDQVLYHCYKTGFGVDNSKMIRGNDAYSLPLQVAKITVT
jgi:hypothetical protein